MSTPRDHVRASLRQLKPYQAGKPIEDVKRELGLTRVVKLASNEYPEPPFPEVLEAIAREARQLHRYPDTAWFDLRAAVSSHYGIGPDELFFGNGANEVIELVVHMLCGPGDAVVYAHPSFPIYRLVCQSHFESGVAVPTDANFVHDLDAMLAAITPQTRIVFVCNPNNPTGTYVTHDALERFLERVPSDVLVVTDEAYVEFVVADDFPDFFRLRRRFSNLITLRSFSKVYSLAGLRLGYAIGAREVIEDLHRVRQPFNVNRLVQVAACEAIRHQQRVAERRATNRRRLEFVRRGLHELGCRTIPSQANFLLVFTPEPMPDLFDRLLREGVIVRPMDSFGLAPGSFRANVGTDEENEYFLEAMARVLAVEDTV